jgi:hypothetical protein
MPTIASPLRRLAPALLAVAFLAGPPGAGAATPVIDAGDTALCAVGGDGRVTCHGLDASSVAHVTDFTSVAVGLSHACGLRQSGEILCWSDDGPAAAVPPAGTFAAVGAGWSVSCALDPAGLGTCWGDEAGYLEKDVPTWLGAMHGLSVGEFHSCALLPDDSAACWGADVNGQATPEPGPFAAVSAGGGHTCGLRPDGAVDCWGLNNAGQAEDRVAPAGETFVAVSAGSMSTCALTGAGRAVCWGADWQGESTPRAATFSAISVGRGYACGLLTSGALECWGNDPLPEHAYSLRFHAPVDAAPVVNVAKGGRVIPVKVEVFDGDEEVRAGRVTIGLVAAGGCGAATADAVEAHAPAAANDGELRWDAGADRWATQLDTPRVFTPRCLRAEVRVDGTLAGHFLLRLRA